MFIETVASEILYYFYIKVNINNYLNYINLYSKQLDYCIGVYVDSIYWGGSRYDFYKAEIYCLIKVRDKYLFIVVKHSMFQNSIKDIFL